MDFRVFRRFLAPAAPSVVLGEGDTDLLIPVFNRPDELRDLLRNLESTVFQHPRLRTIHIGNDGSDPFTRDAIDALVRESKLPIIVSHRTKNLGFGGNCNDLFSRSSAAYCILLNTDITLPPRWLERMLAPFRDPTVALCTPLSTNAANHTIRLRAGETWIDADALLQERTPIFPDDCTAIGFCMAVSASVLRKKAIPLFDTAFGRGYGEDTDLHYRVVTAGLRSVIVDNLLVRHEGAASFGVLPEYAEVRARGEAMFREKWGTEHTKRFEAFQALDALGAIRDASTSRLVGKQPLKHLDVLFVLPNTNLRYGGVWVVCRLARHLIERGFSVGIFVIDPAGAVSDVQPFGFAPMIDADELKNAVASISCVVSTSDRTLSHGKRLAEEYRARELLFLQNMEVVFRSGNNVETYMHFKQAQNVLTVSECLTDYIRLINPRAQVAQLRLGPDPLVFYPRHVKRRVFTVALAANVIPEKGATQALEIALLMRERGFHFTVFGWDWRMTKIDPAIGDILHDNSREALAHLFSHTEFIIDQSHLEGLGLIPIEAAFCGCIPIIGSRGAAEYIFRDGENAIILDGYKNLAESLDRLQHLSPADKARLSQNAMKLRGERNLELGLKDAERFFSRMK